MIMQQLAGYAGLVMIAVFIGQIVWKLVKKKK